VYLCRSLKEIAFRYFSSSAKVRFCCAVCKPSSAEAASGRYFSFPHNHEAGFGQESGVHPQACFIHRFLTCLLFALLFFPAGCREEMSLRNNPFANREIASVDGVPITFREAESRRAHLFSNPSSIRSLETNAALREQYLYVIRQMVEEILITRFMERQGKDLSEGELEEEENLIRGDYPPGTFEQMLMDEGINLVQWRQQLRRMILVRKYIATEIRPRVIPAPEAIQEYYNSHSGEFVIPEQWHFLQISGTDKAEVEAARKALLADKNATKAQRLHLVTIREVQTGSDMLPEDIRRDLAKLAPWETTWVASPEKGFSVLVFLDKTPQAPLDAARVTARVEQILTENSLAEAYGEMVARLVKKAKVRIADVLLLPDKEEGTGTLRRGGESGAN
jgi:hypothetical protein